MTEPHELNYGRKLGKEPEQIDVQAILGPPRVDSGPPLLPFLLAALVLGTALLSVIATQTTRQKRALLGSPSVPAATAPGLRGVRTAGATPMNLLPPEQLRPELVERIDGGKFPKLHMRDGTVVNVNADMLTRLPGALRVRLEYPDRASH